MKSLVLAGLIMIYNLALISGACYLVYWKDASAWVIVAALICMFSLSGVSKGIK